MTDLRTRSDTRLVSGVLEGYRPIAHGPDLGELSFLNARLQKINASISGCHINENSEHLQKTEGG